MSMAVYLNASSYINWDKHECYFDSDEFKEFLAFMKEFPEDYDYSNYEYRQGGLIYLFNGAN